MDLSNEIIKKVAEVHLVAGLVPKNVSVDEFAQALRSIGEPIFGQSVKDISGGNLPVSYTHLTLPTKRIV